MNFSSGHTGDGLIEHITYSSVQISRVKAFVALIEWNEVLIYKERYRLVFFI